MEKDKKESVLSKIYGFKPEEILAANNGYWDIEQYMDDEMVYQARILPNQDTYISVFTRDRFPKTIAEYKFEPEDGIKDGTEAGGTQGNSEKKGRGIPSVETGNIPRLWNSAGIGISIGR